MAHETEVQTVPDLRELIAVAARFDGNVQVLVSTSVDAVDAFAAVAGVDVTETGPGHSRITSMTVREGAVTVTVMHVPEQPGSWTRPPLRRPTSVSEELSGRDL